MNRSFFVTGTDTGVGKTFIARKLLEQAAASGLSTLGLKPVAAGCEKREGTYANEDAWQLMQASSIQPAYSDVNPVALREPMAPHIAADKEGRSLSATALAEHCLQRLTQAEFCVIEGAGGWDVPLNKDESMADLATQIGAPVILVVGMRLGCINHTLLTVDAIEAAGLCIAGWVANHIDPAMAVQDENFSTLEHRLPAPCIGRVAWRNDQAGLDIKRLLQS